MIVHIVMFKFKEENKEQNIVKAQKMLHNLVETIEELNGMEVGINFDTTPRAFDLSLYATFETKEDLKIYATHPQHLQVVEFIKSVTIESKVVDYVKES